MFLVFFRRSRVEISAVKQESVEVEDKGGEEKLVASKIDDGR
jgi:hypothetical protein